LSAAAGGDGALSVNPDLAEEDVTMLYVTHEMGFARGVANKVIFMGQGQIVEQNSLQAVPPLRSEPGAG
jgi:polar amino acid transport system ATP-binding protein